MVGVVLGIGDVVTDVYPSYVVDPIRLGKNGPEDIFCYFKCYSWLVLVIPVDSLSCLLVPVRLVWCLGVELMLMRLGYVILDVIISWY